MTQRTGFFVTLIALAIPGLAGCMPTMSIEEMKAMAPERPVELDRLAVFVGEWESTGEAEFAGLDRTLKATGTATFNWANDKWCLIEQDEFELEEFGEMKGTGIWTYDSKSKKYRSWWFDSYGGTGRGTGTYDDSTQTWKFKGKSRAEWGNTSFRANMTFLDNDTLEWDYTERAFFGLFKVADFQGTMRRK